MFVCKASRVEQLSNSKEIIV